MLLTFRGYLQADGHGGYEGIALSDDYPILKVACWVHVRRTFRDALRTDRTTASLALGFIGHLSRPRQHAPCAGVGPTALIRASPHCHEQVRSPSAVQAQRPSGWLGGDLYPPDA